jgi:hypothetical protein
MTENAGSKRQIEYVAPAPEVLEQVARGVCHKLAESDPSFKDADVVYGFAAFLSVVARMHANRLNKLKSSASSHSLDSGS